jgi:hypothetical protein
MKMFKINVVVTCIVCALCRVPCACAINVNTWRKSRRIKEHRKNSECIDTTEGIYWKKSENESARTKQMCSLCKNQTSIGLPLRVVEKHPYNDLLVCILWWEISLLLWVHSRIACLRMGLRTNQSSSSLGFCFVAQQSVPLCSLFRNKSVNQRG